MKKLIEKTRSKIIQLRNTATSSSSTSKSLSIQERAQNFFYALKNPKSTFLTNSKPYALFFSLLVSAYVLSHFILFAIDQYVKTPEPPSLRTQSPQQLSSQKDVNFYSIILRKNLFNAAVEDESMVAPEASGAPVKSTLPYDLIGTLVFKDGEKSIATLIERNSKKTYPIRMNESIPGQMRITEVQPQKVIFVNLMQNKNEYIELPESSFTKKQTTTSAAPPPPSGAQIERVAGNKFQIPRSELESSLANMNQILTQARALPDPEGFRLIQIQSGSIYEKLGLQNGDIITMINGEPLRDPLKAMEYFQQIKDLPGLDLAVKRNGQVMNFSYEIN